MFVILFKLSGRLIFELLLCLSIDDHVPLYIIVLTLKVIFLHVVRFTHLQDFLAQVEFDLVGVHGVEIKEDQAVSVEETGQTEQLKILVMLYKEIFGVTLHRSHKVYIWNLSI